MDLIAESSGFDGEGLPHRQHMKASALMGVETRIRELSYLIALMTVEMLAVNQLILMLLRASKYLALTLFMLLY